jgi:hypothetical protein
MGNQQHGQMIRKPRLQRKKALQICSAVSMAELDILAQIDLAVVDSPLHFHPASMFVGCTAPSGFY